MSWKKAVSLVSSGKHLLQATLAQSENLPQAGFAHNHLYLTRQAVRLLEDAGYSRKTFLLREYLGLLEAGACWADTGFQSTGHYFNPISQRGLWRWPSSAALCEKYVQKAGRCWDLGDLGRAFFFAGVSLHLVQDSCAPHHCAGTPWFGHSAYEVWVLEHHQLFRAGDILSHRSIDRPCDWIIENSRLAFRYFPLVSTTDTDFYYEVTSRLFNLAQATGAGYLAYLLDDVFHNWERQLLQLAV